jgi:hypothetical protein
MDLSLHWEVRFGTCYHLRHRVLRFMEVTDLIVHILPETLWEV